MCCRTDQRIRQGARRIIARDNDVTGYDDRAWAVVQCPTSEGDYDRNVRMAVVFSHMDWKSTVVISGAGILATWFFSMPPSQPPVAPAARTTRAARAAAPTVDIEKEAARLHVRPRSEAHYTEPARNPFRFSTRREPTRPTAGIVAPAAPVGIVPLVPPPPTITLDGVASDTLNGQDQRTAILHTDAGMVLAKEGDQVSGYRVEKISADAVELTKSDGSKLRLGLR